MDPQESRRLPKLFAERLFALSEEMLGVIARDGWILQHNPIWERALGFTGEELRGMRMRDLLHPDDIQGVVDVVQNLETVGVEQRGSYESRLRRKDGAYRWYLWSVVYDGAEDVYYVTGHDVTARKAADERFRVLFEHSSDAHFICEDDLRIVDCNPAAVAMLRCRDKSELIGRHPGEMSSEVQPDGRRSQEKSLEMDALARQYGHHRFEWVHRKMDGEEFPVEVFLTRVSLAGRPAMLVVWHDLTERKRAQRALEESEALFRTLCESAPVGIYRSGVKGHCYYVNPHWLQMSGMTLEESLGTGWVRSIHLDDRPRVMDEWRKAVSAGKAFSTEYRFVDKQGAVHHVQARATPVPGGDVYVGTVEDVTDQKRAELERARMAAVVEAMPSLILLSNGKGTSTFINRAGRRMLGLPEDADITKLRFEHVVPTREVARLRHEALPNAIRTGSWQGDSYIKSRDGREIPTTTVFLAHKDENGALEFISSIAHDMTERKAVERMKSEFVSTVSHELRTPLTSIRGALRLIEGGVMGKLPEEAMELVSIASNNTERLVRLINDLLDLEKIEAGRLDLSVRDLDPGRLATTVVEGIRGMADQAGVGVSVELGDKVAVRGDEDRLVQVLTNLVSNAIKFSPAGSRVTVRVGCSEPKRLRFSVVDTGPGIPETAVSKLFGKFQQLDSSDSRRKGGTGLGLAISKAIVEQHGGRIGVDTRVGQGSTFWFELPVT